LAPYAADEPHVEGMPAGAAVSVKSKAPIGVAICAGANVWVFALPKL
jgi:hypothetical protein